MNKKLQAVLNQFKQTILLQAHPVGSVYMSFDNVDPATLFGGLWQLLDEGKFLRSTTTTAGISGGADTFSLKANNIPSLDVAFDTNYKTDGRTNSVGLGTSATTSKNAGYILPTGLVYADGNGTSRTSSLAANWDPNTGSWKISGDAVSNVPAHITVYMWKRIG